MVAVISAAAASQTAREAPWWVNAYLVDPPQWTIAATMYLTVIVAIFVFWRLSRVETTPEMMTEGAAYVWIYFVAMFLTILVRESGLVSLEATVLIGGVGGHVVGQELHRWARRSID